jgi:hypothetical protein
MFGDKAPALQISGERTYSGVPGHGFLRCVSVLLPIEALRRILTMEYIYIFHRMCTGMALPRLEVIHNETRNSYR